MRIENGKIKKLLVIYCIFLCVLLGCVGLFFTRIQWFINMNTDVYRPVSEFEKEIEELQLHCKELEKEIFQLKGED